MKYYLLQKSNELACSPLVWLGQIEILEVNNEPLTVLGSIYSTSVGGDDHTNLMEGKKGKAANTTIKYREPIDDISVSFTCAGMAKLLATHLLVHKFLMQYQEHNIRHAHVLLVIQILLNYKPPLVIYFYCQTFERIKLT